MALNPGNVQGYNNKIVIARSGAAIGHNPGINESELIHKTAGDQSFEGKIAAPAGTDHMGPPSGRPAGSPTPAANAPVAPQQHASSRAASTSHEEEKTALIAAGVGAGLLALWFARAGKEGKIAAPAGTDHMGPPSGRPAGSPTPAANAPVAPQQHASSRAASTSHEKNNFNKKITVSPCFPLSISAQKLVKTQFKPGLIIHLETDDSLGGGAVAQGSGLAFWRFGWGLASQSLAPREEGSPHRWPRPINTLRAMERLFPAYPRARRRSTR